MDWAGVDWGEVNENGLWEMGWTAGVCPKDVVPNPSVGCCGVVWAPKRLFCWGCWAVWPNKPPVLKVVGVWPKAGALVVGVCPKLNDEFCPNIVEQMDIRISKQLSIAVKNRRKACNNFSSRLSVESVTWHVNWRFLRKYSTLRSFFLYDKFRTNWFIW